MSNELIERLLSMLKEASHHVYRQRYYGKHEQDREDAEDWTAKYKALKKALNEIEQDQLQPQQSFRFQ
mgnify:CR=1 FL=1